MLKFVPRTAGVSCDAKQIKQIAQATGLLAPVAQLLCGRGINTPTAAKRFLHPGPEQLHDPFLLPDMHAAVARIQRAQADGEPITVFCDYDADGICGGSALYLYLKGQGADVSILTPNRHKEGYGLSQGAVKQMAASGVKLIVTVDCGITNLYETALAKSLGMDVIITDHHECGEALPDTPYIVNPKRADSVYPCGFLAGCGVAFKLIHALSSLSVAMRYIDIVAIGTITDIVPLLDENRVIAHMGITKMRSHPSAGIAALSEAAGLGLPGITSYGVSFVLGPRINAAGRMDTADAAIDIMLAQKRGPALQHSAARLCALNDERKKEVEDILRGAEAMIRRCGYAKDPAILLADQSWNAGVIGIAAAKIAEKYTRPCVLFGANEGDLVGSARSIDGINIYEALGAFADRYEKFGGHAQAAGLTIVPAVLEDLRRDLCDYITRHYDESVFEKRKVYDMSLAIGDITEELVADIGRLEPFGACNEKPCVAVFGADMTETRFIGKEDQPHLKFVMRQDGAGIDAISFFFRDTHAFASRTGDFLAEADINDFSKRPQLVVRHMAMKFDPVLVESFLAAHRQHMAQHFLDEAVCLQKDAVTALDELAFSAAIRRALDESRFGFCIAVDTAPALECLLRLGVVRDALLDEKLCFYDARSFTVDNCVACGAADGYERICFAGVPGGAPQDGKLLGVWFDAEMMDAYRRCAAQYFMPRGALLEIYRRLSFTKPMTAQQISCRLAMTPEKTAFALRVFCELELIPDYKSDKILALKFEGQKKDLRQSVCYRSIEDIVNGR